MYLLTMYLRQTQMRGWEDHVVGTSTNKWAKTSRNECGWAQTNTQTSRTNGGEQTSGDEHEWVLTSMNDASPNRNPPSSNPMYFSTMGSSIPKNQPIRISLAKPEPRWLGFRIFGTNQSPPPCLTELRPPATSNSMYSTPIGSTLPKNQPTRHSLAKTEPLLLGF